LGNASATSREGGFVGGAGTLAAAALGVRTDRADTKHTLADLEASVNALMCPDAGVTIGAASINNAHTRPSGAWQLTEEIKRFEAPDLGNVLFTARITAIQVRLAGAK
jgi:hypothetical protein